MEKPEPGASRAEMSAWMEHDFWTQVADGMGEDEDDESSDEDLSDE